MSRVERGVLVAFDAGTYRAVVRLEAALASDLPDVPVSAAIDAALMIAGASVAVAVFDEFIGSDRVVIAVW